jgi:hypothetical protein
VGLRARGLRRGHELLWRHLLERQYDEQRQGGDRRGDDEHGLDGVDDVGARGGRERVRGVGRAAAGTSGEDRAEDGGADRATKGAEEVGGGARDAEAVERLAAITRVITDSPALLAREQQIFAGYTASLAALLAEETRARADAVEPWVAANALMGVHRALVDYTRRPIVDGMRNPRLARQVRAQAKQALALLDEGLSRYAVNDRPRA